MASFNGPGDGELTNSSLMQDSKTLSSRKRGPAMDEVTSHIVKSFVKKMKSRNNGCLYAP
jgi:hypothetical protein